jgi:hypothetical protein
VKQSLKWIISVEEETVNDSCNAASERIDFSFLHGEVYKPVKNQVNFFTSDFKILETQVYVVLIMMILDQRGTVLDRVSANNCLL